MSKEKKVQFPQRGITGRKKNFIQNKFIASERQPYLDDIEKIILLKETKEENKFWTGFHPTRHIKRTHNCLGSSLSIKGH